MSLYRLLETKRQGLLRDIYRRKRQRQMAPEVQAQMAQTAFGVNKPYRDTLAQIEADERNAIDDVNASIDREMGAALAGDRNGSIANNSPLPVPKDQSGPPMKALGTAKPDPKPSAMKDMFEQAGHAGDNAVTAHDQRFINMAPTMQELMDRARAVNLATVVRPDRRFMGEAPQAPSSDELWAAQKAREARIGAAAEDATDRRIAERAVMLDPRIAKAKGPFGHASEWIDRMVRRDPVSWARRLFG